MSGLDRWMPFYVADYFGDTNHLSTTEHGAYILLLMHYWRQGPLPNKDAVLANITRLERRHWRRVSEVIRNFFTLEDDGLLHQKRMDKELARTAHLSAVRRVAATSPRKGRKPPGGDGPAPAPRPAPPRPAKARSGRANGHASGAQNTVNGEAGTEHLHTHARDAVHLQIPSLLRKESKKPPLRSGPASGSGPPSRSPRDQVMQEGGTIVQALTGLTGRRACSFVGHLVKIARDDCSRVLAAVRQAEQDRPVDPQTWLIAACKPEGLSHEAKISRDWRLTSFGDAAE